MKFWEALLVGFFFVIVTTGARNVATAGIEWPGAVFLSIVAICITSVFIAILYTVNAFMGDEDEK